MRFVLVSAEELIIGLIISLFTEQKPTNSSVGAFNCLMAGEF